MQTQDKIVHESDLVCSHCKFDGVPFEKGAKPVEGYAIFNWINLMGTPKIKYLKCPMCGYVHKVGLENRNNVIDFALCTGNT